MTNHNNESTKPPMPPLSQLLDGYSGLTSKQYGVLRDAGFTSEILEHKTQAFYTKVKPHASYHTANSQATDLQLAYIEGRNVPLDIPLESLTYGAARQVLRSVAKYDDDDPKYLKYIAGKEKDNADRAERKRNAKASNAADPAESREEPARRSTKELMGELKRGMSLE